MLGPKQQLPPAEPHSYIFDLRSLLNIELTLRRTINHRFSAKIHFRPARPAHPSDHTLTPAAHPQHSYAPHDALDKLTPAKSTNKEMAGLTAVSKNGKEEEREESPEEKGPYKGKLIFKERTPPAKSTRLARPRCQALRL